MEQSIYNLFGRSRPAVKTIGDSEVVESLEDIEANLAMIKKQRDTLESKNLVLQTQMKKLQASKQAKDATMKISLWKEFCCNNKAIAELNAFHDTSVLTAQNLRSVMLREKMSKNLNRSTALLKNSGIGSNVDKALDTMNDARDVNQELQKVGDILVFPLDPTADDDLEMERQMKIMLSENRSEEDLILPSVRPNAKSMLSVDSVRTQPKQPDPTPDWFDFS